MNTLCAQLLQIPAGDDAKLKEAIDQHQIAYDKRTWRSSLKEHVRRFANDNNIYTGHIRALNSVWKQIGKVFNRHDLADNTYTADLKDVRKSITTAYGQEQGMKLIKASGVSDSKRTKKRNTEEKEKRDARHAAPFNISLEKIESICEKMKDDIESANPAYKNTPILLAELCIGARIGECIDASNFKIVAKSKRPEPKNVEWIEQKGVLKKRMQQAGAGDDDDDADEQPGGVKDGYVKNAVLIKPMLPYVTASFMLDSLAAWRAANGIVGGNYNLKNMEKYQNRINILLRKRYLSTDDLPDNNATRIKTHLLRAIYAQAAFKLFGQDNETISLFTQKVLGHEALETGLSYSYVKISDSNEQDGERDEDEPGANDVEDNTEEELVPPIKIARNRLPPKVKAREDNLAEDEPITTQLKKENAALKKENAALKKRIAALEKN